MEAERRNSKGSFFQLFDWNSKSRKKLFSNKSELADTERSKQGNQNVAKSLNFPQLIEARETKHGLTSANNDDYIPSSVVTDDRYATKAPGVVARLMGLDCLPTSAAPESGSTPSNDPSISLNNGSQRLNSRFPVEYHYVNNPGNLVDPRLPKVQNRAVERFQSEMLPSKSAKPIPIAHHHRLLSPIKNPGFVPTNDLAYIMEASSKIIDQSPQSATKGNRLHFASSSTPLRMRDVRERMEAVPRGSGHSEALRRSKEPVSTQCNRGPNRERKHSGSIDTQANNAAVKNKGKSSSLAVQAKVNVQRKGLVSGESRRSAIRKEADDVKVCQNNQGQMTLQKSVQKRNALSRTSGVLEQNNQKQNCGNTREKLPPKASVPTQQNRKSQPVNGSVRPVKASASSKINTMAKDSGKEIVSSKTKTISEKNESSRGNMYFEDSVGDNMPISKDHNKEIKCNITYDSDAGEMPSSSMDVVSFAFTSPSKKSLTVSGFLGKLTENGNNHSDEINYSPKVPTLYSPRSNVTGGDALSILLEQKLKELTCRVESSDCNFDNAGSASSTFSVMESSRKEECIDFELNLRKVKSSACGVAKWEGLQEIEGKSSGNGNSEYGKEGDCRYSSLTSTLEPSSSDGSYDSSDLNCISITKGSKGFHLTEPHEMVDCISNGVSQSLEADFEYSDSASSSSVALMSGNYSSPTMSLTDFKRSPKWELEYITKILFCSDLVLDDLVLGQVNKVLNSDLFDHLENLQIVNAQNAEEYLKLERKVLFDCAGECLNLRGEELLGGNCKALLKWGTLFQRKGFLANDLCKEITGFSSLKELMVDELVDKDMSFGNGKWVDFETEEFEVGVEIEETVLTSLVDELAFELLFDMKLLFGNGSKLHEF